MECRLQRGRRLNFPSLFAYDGSMFEGRFATKLKPSHALLKAVKLCYDISKAKSFNR